jgi:hypothetical protein
MASSDETGLMLWNVWSRYKKRVSKNDLRSRLRYTLSAVPVVISLPARFKMDLVIKYGDFIF